MTGYTCAEIELVVNEAARMALGRKRGITDEDIAKARRDNPPAHSGEGLARMRDGKTD